MKAFTYIDENHEEQLDLLRLLEYAFDYKVSTEEIIHALIEIEKYASISIIDKAK
tara:strand:- start:663 stop:827 length:165 start_codon:yes stop_codon:yes gene_type:complete